MRSLWLASAASLFIAGAACAQTSQPGPAPTGAPNAATMTNPGQSPGSTAPATSGGAMAAPAGAPVNNASGAPSGPTVTTPGTSPGKTTGSGMSSSMSTSGMSSSTSTTSEYKPMHHHYMGGGMGMGGKMPADATAGQYLHMAKGAIKHHNKMMADDALSHAETRMLDRSVPQGEITADSDPAIGSIESARKALMAGDMKTANMDIDMAMHQTGGMSSDSGMSGGGMSSGGMAGGGMSSGGMSSGSKGSGVVMPNPRVSSEQSGGAPAPGETSDSGAASSGTTVTGTMSPTKPPSSP